jgi:hypothetical protein
MTLPLFFSAASLLCCGLFFIYFHRYIRRRTSPESILAECEDAVAGLEAQIDAITDRDVQLVEDRVKNLKRLLEDADRRISLLSRIESQRRPAETLYSPLSPLENRLRFAGPGPIPSLSPAASAPAAPGMVSGDTASGSGTGPEATPDSAMAPVPGPIPEPGEDARPLVDRVAELDRAGFSPELIASRLGVSVSEAELAVAVSRHSRPAS